MASTWFGLQVDVTSPAPIKGLTGGNKGGLFAKPKIERKKRKQAGNVIRPTVAQDEGAEEEILSLEDLSEGYGELIARANTILETLKDRLKDLTYTFDPGENPETAEALGEIFQGENSRITYAMYLAALKLDKDLSVEIGESESGFTK